MRCFTLVIIIISVALAFSAVVNAAPNPTPEHFRVQFISTAGPIVFNITRSYSPNGVDRLYQLLGNGYYNGNRFFRVIQGCVLEVQMIVVGALTKFE